MLIPDMVLSYRTAVEYSAGHSVVTCLRKDKEKVSSENLDDAIKNLLRMRNRIWKKPICVLTMQSEDGRTKEQLLMIN